MFHLNQFRINSLIKKIKALQANRVHNQPSDDQLKKEIAYYNQLAELYKKLKHSKKFPHAEILYIACYRNAASLDDAEAHYKLGKMFLEDAKFRQTIQEEGVFADDINQIECTNAFKEAHAHLNAAELLGHIQAKRLKGLALINGWGVTADKSSGFELVVASIDQEGSWDKVPEIFAAIGLNKPEFFAAIMQRRKLP